METSLNERNTVKKSVLVRAEKLRGTLKERNADAFVVIEEESCNKESLFYMTGFRGTAGAFILYLNDSELILDSRYIEQGRDQSPYQTLLQKRSLTEDICASLKRHGAKNVLCEADRTYRSTWEKLSSCGAFFSDGGDLMKRLRRTKDEFEIACIRKAAEIAAEAFINTLNCVHPGMTEKEFEALLEYNTKSAGGETGFDMIVASGLRSSMPHGVASDKKMEAGEWATVDFGVRFNGYFCDITRNFSIGPTDGRAAELHALLLSAHRRAADMLRSGAEGRAVHETAASVLSKRGMARYFTHGLGHSFGLEIHEFPSLSPKRNDVLQEKDTITIEPGIYIEGWGGLRLEDDYLILVDKAERLTGKLPQEFFTV